MPPLHRRFPIEIGRLLLRPIEPADLEALFAIYSRDDVSTYLYEEPRTRAEIEVMLQTKIARRAIEAEGDTLALAIVRADTGTFVGDLVLNWASALHRQAEIGFVLHPDHHGNGFATEAATELLRIAFEELGAHRVFGRTEARNLASARVLERLGMRREAHLVENEWVKAEWQSELVYAILDREWRSGASAPTR